MLGRELMRRGHDVTFYTTRFDPKTCFPGDTSQVKVVSLKPERVSEVKERRRAFVPEGFNILYNEGILAREVAELIDPETEVVHPNDTWGARAGCSFKSRNPKAVSVLMLNDVVTARWSLFDDPMFGRKRNPLKRPIEWTKDMLERPAFRAQDLILVLSDRTGEQVRTWIGQDASTIRSGVDHERFKFVPRTFPPNNRPIRLVSHGIFYIHRRYEDTIEAVKLLADRGIDAELNIIGDHQHKSDARTYLAKLQALVAKLGLEKKVSFAGRVSDDELIRSFYDSDAFISAAHMQTWGIAPFEALATGLPVAVSTTIGASEILEDGKTAMKFEPGDPESQTNAVARLFKDKETYERLSRDGNAFVRGRLSWKRYADDMLSFFEAAIKAKNK
jgi:glycosyltransferase involved in cell wall biosynthesis